MDFFFFLETVGSHRFEKEFHTDMIITAAISCYLYKTEVGEPCSVGPGSSAMEISGADVGETN